MNNPFISIALTSKTHLSLFQNMQRVKSVRYFLQSYTTSLRVARIFSEGRRLHTFDLTEALIFPDIFLKTNNELNFLSRPNDIK